MGEPGRPLKFISVEELESKIEEYFEYCDNTIVKKILNKNQEVIAEITKPYTITGLAHWLGTNRQTLINYEKKDGFFDTIKDAKSRIEACYEERALLGDNSPVVSIFTLKNNFNWKDKTEQDITSAGKKLKSITGINYITPDKNGNNIKTDNQTTPSISGTEQ